MEEPPWKAPRGTPRASASETPQVVATQATLAIEVVVVPQAPPAIEAGAALERASEEQPAAGGAAGREHALVPRRGGRRTIVSRPARGGAAVVFGPQTQEEPAMDTVSRHLRGRMDHIEDFAQAEVERTRELERAVLVSSLSAF